MYGEAAYDVNAGSRDSFDYNDPCRGEHALWTAVITQALQDMKTNSKKPEDQAAKIFATQWVYSEDFKDVCDRAGMDPRYVKRKILEARERGFEWRLPAGQGWRSKLKLQETAAP